MHIRTRHRNDPPRVNFVTTVPLSESNSALTVVVFSDSQDNALASAEVQASQVLDSGGTEMVIPIPSAGDAAAVMVTLSKDAVDDRSMEELIQDVTRKSHALEVTFGQKRSADAAEAVLAQEREHEIARLAEEVSRHAKAEAELNDFVKGLNEHLAEMQAAADANAQQAQERAEDLEQRVEELKRAVAENAQEAAENSQRADDSERKARELERQLESAEREEEDGAACKLQAVAALVDKHKAAAGAGNGGAPSSATSQEPAELQLQLSVRDLAPRDWLSSADPMVGVFVKEGDSYVLKGTTEWLRGKPSADFQNTVSIPMSDIESQSELTLMVFDMEGNPQPSRQVCSGSVQVGDLSESPTSVRLSHPSDRELNAELAQKQSKLLVSATRTGGGAAAGSQPSGVVAKNSSGDVEADLAELLRRLADDLAHKDAELAEAKRRAEKAKASFQKVNELYQDTSGQRNDLTNQLQAANKLIAELRVQQNAAPQVFSPLVDKRGVSSGFIVDDDDEENVEHLRQALAAAEAETVRLHKQAEQDAAGLRVAQQLVPQLDELVEANARYEEEIVELEAHLKDMEASVQDRDRTISLMTDASSSTIAALQANQTEDGGQLDLASQVVQLRKQLEDLRLSTSPSDVSMTLSVGCRAAIKLDGKWRECNPRAAVYMRSSPEEWTLLGTTECKQNVANCDFDAQFDVRTAALKNSYLGTLRMCVYDQVLDESDQDDPAQMPDEERCIGYADLHVLDLASQAELGTGGLAQLQVPLTSADEVTKEKLGLRRSTVVLTPSNVTIGELSAEASQNVASHADLVDRLRQKNEQLREADEQFAALREQSESMHAQMSERIAELEANLGDMSGVNDASMRSLNKSSTQLRGLHSSPQPDKHGQSGGFNDGEDDLLGEACEQCMRLQDELERVLEKYEGQPNHAELHDSLGREVGRLKAENLQLIRTQSDLDSALEGANQVVKKLREELQLREHDQETGQDLADLSLTQSPTLGDTMVSYAGGSNRMALTLGVRDLGWISPCNPLIVAFVKKSSSSRWLPLGRTEWVLNSGNVDFERVIMLRHYGLQDERQIRFCAYESETAAESQDNFVGAAYTTVNKLVTTRGSDLSLHLRNREDAGIERRLEQADSRLRLRCTPVEEDLSLTSRMPLAQTFAPRKSTRIADVHEMRLQNERLQVLNQALQTNLQQKEWEVAKLTQTAGPTLAQREQDLEHRFNELRVQSEALIGKLQEQNTELSAENAELQGRIIRHGTIEGPAARARELKEAMRRVEEERHTVWQTLKQLQKVEQECMESISGSNKTEEDANRTEHGAADGEVGGHAVGDNNQLGSAKPQPLLMRLAVRQLGLDRTRGPQGPVVVVHLQEADGQMAFIGRTEWVQGASDTDFEQPIELEWLGEDGPRGVHMSVYVGCEGSFSADDLVGTALVDMADLHAMAVDHAAPAALALTYAIEDMGGDTPRGDGHIILHSSLKQQPQAQSDGAGDAAGASAADAGAENVAEDAMPEDLAEYVQRMASRCTETYSEAVQAVQLRDERLADLRSVREEQTEELADLRIRILPTEREKDREARFVELRNEMMDLVDKLQEQNSTLTSENKALREQQQGWTDKQDEKRRMLEMHDHMTQYIVKLQAECTVLREKIKDTHAPCNERIQSLELRLEDLKRRYDLKCADLVTLQLTGPDTKERVTSPVASCKSIGLDKPAARSAAIPVSRRTGSSPPPRQYATDLDSSLYPRTPTTADCSSPAPVSLAPYNPRPSAPLNSTTGSNRSFHLSVRSNGAAPARSPSYREPTQSSGRKQAISVRR